MTDVPDGDAAPSSAGAATTDVEVGDVRPTQMLFVYGVGALVDLPNLSVMVMGLDDWIRPSCRPIAEARLLDAVRRRLGDQVDELLSPPPGDGAGSSQGRLVGVPVAPFPRWLVCTACRELWPLRDRTYQLDVDPYRPEATRYSHVHCRRKWQKPPAAFPARFLFACPRGHLDDFPWVHFVHDGATACQGPFTLRELGPSGEAADVIVSCMRCDKRKSMAQAFGEAALDKLPRCRGRRAHLRDFEPDGCGSPARTLLLGASNAWFPACLSVLSIPTETTGELDRLVDELWATKLEFVTSREVLAVFLKTPEYRPLTAFALDEVWAAVERRRAPPQDAAQVMDLKLPEWEAFTDPSGARQTPDFRLAEVAAPPDYTTWIERVVLVERLREVRALTGFSRIDAPGDLTGSPNDRANIAPLTRNRPKWVPAGEVRGEGIFIQLREAAVEAWLRQPAVEAREGALRRSHRAWNELRQVTPPDSGFPGMRFVLLHSLAHALIRQVSLECGYSAASIRERLYSRSASEPGGPMAGVLLYTAAPDSEGTLGGLVNLGRTAELGQHLRAALQQVSLCASDPLCAEHEPSSDGRALHGAACHACLLVSETSCERGNRYLDRAALIRTVAGKGTFGMFAQAGP